MQTSGGARPSGKDALVSRCVNTCDWIAARARISCAGADLSSACVSAIDHKSFNALY